jgi:hypothetical protein
LGSECALVSGGAPGAATGVAAAIRVGADAVVASGIGADAMLATWRCVMIFGGCVVTIVAVR